MPSPIQKKIHFPSSGWFVADPEVTIRSTQLFCDLTVASNQPNRAPVCAIEKVRVDASTAVDQFCRIAEVSE
jgi:hypothetical protein